MAAAGSMSSSGQLLPTSLHPLLNSLLCCRFDSQALEAMQQQQRVLAQANQLSASQQQQQQDTDSFGGFGDLEQPADQLDAQLQGAGGFDAQQQQDAADEGAAAAGGDADELIAGLLHSPTPSGAGAGTGGQLGLRGSCHGRLWQVHFSGVRHLAQTGLAMAGCLCVTATPGMTSSTLWLMNITGTL